MKKTCVFTAAAIALVAPLWVQAEEGFYIGAQGGVNFLSCQFLTKRHCAFDAGYNLGIVGGYAWCRGFRVEAEITYRDNGYRLHGSDENGNRDTFHGHVDTWSFMANGYYDLPICIGESITPYIGAGIGYDHVHQVIKIAGENFKGSNHGFAWQLMGGASLYLVGDIALSVEYEFHSAPLRRGHELQNHSITLGVKEVF